MQHFVALGKDANVSGCRSESMTCVPAIKYIHKYKHVIYIFHVLNTENKTFYIISIGITITFLVI